jgi:hypothetical protein
LNNLEQNSIFYDFLKIFNDFLMILWFTGWEDQGRAFNAPAARENGAPSARR